jgi:hypothetical protein
MVHLCRNTDVPLTDAVNRRVAPVSGRTGAGAAAQ